MSTFTVPTRDEVGPQNQERFDQLEKAVGFVPNLYAAYAYSDHALGNYLALSGSKTSLSSREKEVVNLAVSEVNACTYCLSAHTAIGKMNGFTEEEILEFRQGFSNRDSKLDALAALAKNVVERRGATDENVLDRFFAAGYTKGNLIDTLVLVGDKTISNYVHRTTQVPVDFPEVQPLSPTSV